MAPSPRPPLPDAPVTVQQEVAHLSALPEVRAALAWLRAQEVQFAHWQVEMARIPAPPFGEAPRGAWLKERFVELGLEDVSIDEVGNVFGTRRGLGKNCVTLSAHMDTVFPAGTPLNVRQHGSRLYGPGVSDNGAALTALQELAAALRASKVKKGKAICGACGRFSLLPATKI
jgi:acetylornithine deacetylase/succinyl-diaminopimelate desuccinylase-like protein